MVADTHPEITIDTLCSRYPMNASAKLVSVQESARAPLPFPKARLCSLDGLRALSISLVILGHLSGTPGFKALDLGIGDYAHLGVLVFFVISGFLITTLLLAEQWETGSVSLKLFYARRSLRIFPASYFFLACVTLLWAAHVLSLHPRDLWHAVTYTVNYEPHPSWQIGHLWSLSVEEQFYLLWPFVFVRSGRRGAVWAAASVMAVAVAARVANRVFLIGTPYHDLEMFPMVADSLAAGCLLAMLRGWLEEQKWYLRLFHPASSFVVLALILVVNHFSGYTLVSVFGTSLTNVGLAILIHRSVYRAGDSIGLFLNWKPVATVGVLSYSLYLWQQLFLNRYSGAWVNAFPQNVILAAGAAMASYFILEKPLLKLRRRLHP